jgi:hypothetical protein
VQQQGDVILYISRDGQTICRNYPAQAQNIRRNATIAIGSYLQLGGSDERTWTRLRALVPNEAEFAVKTFQTCMDFLDGITTWDEYRLQRRRLADLQSRLSGLNAVPSSPGRPQLATSATPARYVLYQDPRFGFTIYYPAHLLTPQGEASTGNGETFLSPSGAAKMRVYGVREPLANLPAVRLRARQRIGSSKDYEDGGDTWFAISGFNREGSIVYEKHAWTDGVRRVVTFEYPQSIRRTMDPALEIVERSFRQAPNQ